MDKKTYLPLNHFPDEAQADFGSAKFVLNGGRKQPRVFAYAAGKRDTPQRRGKDFQIDEHGRFPEVLRKR